MCIYKKKREYSDCLPALRIYTIFIKSIYIAECFMNRRQLEPFCCFAFPLPSSLCLCVVARLLTRSVSLFHSHSWRKKFFFQAICESLSLWRICKTKKVYFLLLFLLCLLLFFCYFRWIGNMGKKYTRATYTLLRIPFILYNFFFFFNGYEEMFLVNVNCVCVCVMMMRMNL